MRPTWTPKGALEASRRPLGAESGFRELFGIILDPSKSSKLELKFNQKSSAHLEVYFWLFGGLWGSFGARFWGPFWAPGRVMPFLQKIAPRHSESMIFRGSGGPKMRPKFIPK